MRICIVNWSIRKVGGAEDYLNSIMPALFSMGCELSFAHEVDTPATRDRITMPASIPCWNASELGRRATLKRMTDWNPDLIYVHGLLDPEFEADFLKIAPAVFFSHNYSGICISGQKTFKFPIVRPCGKAFGPACLFRYFPRHCGGGNPLTMWRLFRSESKKLRNLKKYRAIVTHSNHVRDEYIRNGLPESRVHSFVYEVGKPGSLPRPNSSSVAFNGENSQDRGFSLLFVGRMERLKGGLTLLRSIPAVIESLNRPIRVVLAGDGPDRPLWEKKATKLQSRHRQVEIEFTGWVDKTQLGQLYSHTDLLVVPSLWPEPFGRIGPEAGLHGVPVAAFDVGGVSDWLIPGVNGYLASGDPPTAQGLAAAIIKALSDPETHLKLKAGAVAVAGQFRLEHHLESLVELFHNVVDAKTSVVAPQFV